MGVFNNKKGETTQEFASDTSNNIIAQGTVITGNIESDGNFRLDGTLKGDIYVKTKFSIGKTGFVKGNTKSQNALVEGRIQGDIQVHELLTLKSTSVIVGNIKAQDIITEKGCKISGKITTEGIDKKELLLNTPSNASMNGQYVKESTKK